MASIKKNILANYLGQGWSGLMAIAFLPLYIQYLGVEAYGLIGFFTVIQALVMILDMGMSPTLNRAMVGFTSGNYNAQSIRELLRSLELICYSFAIAIMIMAYFFSNFFAREWFNASLLSPEDVAHALMLMALVAALRLCEGIYRGSLYGLERQVWYNCIYSFFSTLRYVGALVILVWFSATIEAFFIWQAAVSVLTLLVLLMGVYQALPKTKKQIRFSQRALLRVWKFAGGMMGITLLTMLFLQLDKVLLSSLVSLKDLGYYSLAATAANVMFMVVTPIAQAIYPQLVQLSLNDDASKMATIYHKTTQLVTVLTASASMLLCFFSGGVIFMWSGNEDLVRNTAPLVSVLVIGSFLNTSAYLPFQLQIAHGWTSLLLKIFTFVVSVSIVLILFIVPDYGVEGAAWVWVAMNAVYLILTSHFMHHKILQGHKWSWYFSDVLIPSAGVMLVMILAKQLQPHSYLDRLEWFLFLFFTGLSAMLVSAMFASSIRQNLLSFLEMKINDN